MDFSDLVPPADLVPASDVENPDDEDDISRFVFNSNHAITSRQMRRTWSGAYDSEDLVLGLEELHAEQVDQDRGLVQEMDDDHPVYVRLHISSLPFLRPDFFHSLFLQAKWRTSIGISAPDTPSILTAIM
jgi:hypothetical protein